MFTGTFIIGILTVLFSITVIDRAQAAGFLNGALSRTVAGGSTAIVSQTWLYGYTNLDSFINACIDGVLGITGYLFILALLTLGAVWVGNLATYERPIV